MTVGRWSSWRWSLVDFGMLRWWRFGKMDNSSEWIEGYNLGPICIWRYRKPDE